MNHPFGFHAKIFLYGPSGAGKSTAGKILADDLNLPFVDLDGEIESRSGMPIPQIFESGGESIFRALETDALRAVCATPEEHIIALGGGALLDPNNRAIAEELGMVICLTAEAGTLIERLSGDAAARPLMQGDPKKNLDDYLARRAAHYESFEQVLWTGNLSPEAVAQKIGMMAGKFHARSMTGAGSGYDVRVRRHSLPDLGEALLRRNLSGPVALVTDQNVAPHHTPHVMKSLTLAGFRVQIVMVPAGEKYKTLETVRSLWDAFLKAGLERDSTAVALGGGVIGDMAGFAASAYLRGIPWVAAPTTLLAMVDASLGGKTGVDLPQGKNLVGAFHAPSLVWVDPEVLLTLPPREFRAGMAEVIKHAVIADPELFEILSEPGRHSNQTREKFTSLPDHLISRAMAVKIAIIREDPFEKGRRMALNFGHTVGHGVELASGFELLHGEAVSIGMAVETAFAERIGIAERGTAQRIIHLLKAAGLPTEIPQGMDVGAVIQAMTLDKKKSRGKIRLALPTRIGDVRVRVEVDNLRDVISAAS